MRENIVVGDPHGTKDEFNQLLDKINYDPKKHRVLIVGDLADRGSDPVGLIKQVRKMELECVLGNHEEKILRWYRHEDIRKLAGKDNPIRVSDQRRDEWAALSKKDLAWISSLPLQIHIKDNWYVVHAGMEPGLPFDQQDIGRIIRLRYVDANGRHVKMKDREQPPDSWFWAERWNQPYNIIFGHQVFPEPRIFKNDNNVCIGVDSGCCFGGALTAYNIERNEFVQVKAKKTYYKRGNK